MDCISNLGGHTQRPVRPGIPWNTYYPVSMECLVLRAVPQDDPLQGPFLSFFHSSPPDYFALELGPLESSSLVFYDKPGGATRFTDGWLSDLKSLSERGIKNLPPESRKLGWVSHKENEI